jgi:peptidoglycan/xylan/chitin deacetylase (PgdA/CDA1 family)
VRGERPLRRPTKTRVETRGRAGTRRKTASRIGLLVAGLLVVLGSAASGLIRSAESSAAPSPTIVSLTFDDGRQTQYSARAPLAAHGMRGTFYINSGLVASTTDGFYMTWGQIQDLAADGNEITGHSLTHPHLTNLSTDAARHEICDDRTNLLNHGFSPVQSFAYPYAEYNATVQSIVRECGYSSARGVGGIRSGSVCGGCPFAETIPPGDAYATLTPEDISSQTSLAAMQSYVTQAEQNGGGWVQFVFHGIGDRGGVPLSQFTAFLDWLQPRAATGTVVRTVYEVISGAPPPPPPPPGTDTVPPVTSIACNGAPCSGWYGAPVSVALTATDSGGVAATRYTTDGTEPTTSSGTLYGGPFTVSTATTVRYRSWDNAGNVEATKTQAIQVDATGPAVSITQPVAGSTITSNRTTIVANASDAQSGIRQVVFRVDGVAIGSTSSAPYQITWRTNKPAAGPHQLTAVATSGAGLTTTSTPVSVTVG